MSLLVQALQPAASQVAATSPETVERPEPGLARGRWEAPAWAFYAVAIGALLAGLCWAALAWRARAK